MIFNILHTATVAYNNSNQTNSLSVYISPEIGMLFFALFIVFCIIFAYFVRAWFVQSAVFDLRRDIKEIKYLIAKGLNSQGIQALDSEGNNMAEDYDEYQEVVNKDALDEVKEKEPAHFFSDFKESLLSLKRPSKMFIYTLIAVTLLFIVGIVIINFY